MADNIILVGTGHILEKSVREVEEVIEREKPDIVAVELCQSRYDALKGNIGDFSVKDAIEGGKPFLMLTHWLLAYVQKRMGSELGIEPGAEMMMAIKKAEALGCEVALVDRPIQITMQRFWKKMKFLEKMKMLFSIIFAIANMGGFGKSKKLMDKDNKEIDLERITDEDVVTELIEELREFSPGAATALLDERDAYIAGSLLELQAQAQAPATHLHSSGTGDKKKIVAVVGAGHVMGIKRLLDHPELIPPREELCSLPTSRLNMKNLLGIGLSVVLIAILLVILLSGIPLNILLQAFFWWFIINGSLSAIGVVVARGHPLSALTAFAMAPLTSLNPFLAAGWFAGLMEARLRRPTAEDAKSILNVESLRDLMRNSMFKIILVAACANIGSMIGTFLGAYVVLHTVGLNIHQIWSGLKILI
ncbi:MAG: TraB/GumN family protein [Methanophagales archaeon]|nr:TraB/GumN family protein [Methanophagales archaeon]